MKLNFKKLRQDIESVSNEIRYVRANGGVSITERKCATAYQRWVIAGCPQKSPDFEEYSKLAKLRWDHSLPGLKEKATILCSIRASHHGRLHRQKVRNPYCTLPEQPKFLSISAEDQEKLIAQHVKNYLQEEMTVDQK